MAARKDKRAQATKQEGERPVVVLATNRRARRDYVVEARIEAGVVLTGSEVKSLRTHTPTIAEGFARFRGDDLVLYGVHILPLSQASYLNHDPTRPRTLLLHKRELARLRARLEAKGQTLVALQMHFRGPYVKVELGVARGRRKGDRRSHEREKEDRKRIREQG